MTSFGLRRGRCFLPIASLGIIASSGWRTRPAHGQNAADTPPSAFACMGEAHAFATRHSADDIRAECVRRLDLHPEPQEPASATAHRLCVVAELMRVVGDVRAAKLYARAIALRGDAGYQLRLADYLRNARGARAPLLEQAERHYQAALDGVRARGEIAGVTDDAIEQWATRGLMLAYQQDGLPLLPWKAFPYRRNAAWPGIALMTGARVAVDTNDTPVDLDSPAEVDDARRFTSEAMFAASTSRKSRPLNKDELRAIARASRRDELMARVRVRARPIGAMDVWYRQGNIRGGQITNYTAPGERNDVRSQEIGAGLTRALDLYPALDALLAATYRRVHRVGSVESSPDSAQDFSVFEARPVIARSLGPDKLSFAGVYATMAIPDIAGGLIAERARARTIASIDMNYALHRLALSRYRLPSVHAFAGSARDDETFGTRVVQRRNAYAGLEIPRIKSWGVTVQASLFSGAVDVRPCDPGQSAGQDPQQGHAQYRTTLVLLRRLIDEDAQPGLPRETHGVRPSMVNVVLTVRHDARLAGLDAFQNVRAGLDLRAKAFVTSLRGTAVMMSAGYDNQYFYAIGKDLHIFHLDLRMGW